MRAQNSYRASANTKTQTETEKARDTVEIWGL